MPAAVTESQKEANVAPEASANAEAVHEKSDVEKELLKKVPESQSAGEPAPTASAATTAVAPISSSSTTTTVPGAASIANTVPAAVGESQKEAHVGPEASANATAVHEKSDVEKELLNKVPESQATGESAPAIASSTKGAGYSIATGPDYTEGGIASGVTGASATKTAGVTEPATSTTSATGKFLRELQPTAVPSSKTVAVELLSRCRDTC